MTGEKPDGAEKETLSEWRDRVSKMSTLEELEDEAARLKKQLFDSGVSADEIHRLEKKIEADVKKKLDRTATSWLVSDKFPRFLLKCFQIFLIVEKLTCSAPFGQYSWWIILLPSILTVISDLVWLSTLSKEELDDLIEKEKRKLKDDDSDPPTK